MQFDTLEMSLTVLDRVAEVEPKIRAKRKSLANEIGRAAESIALNVSEGSQRAGLDKPDLYRRAAGSARETQAHLRVALASGWIQPRDVQEILPLLDRELAILWRLTHPRR